MSFCEGRAEKRDPLKQWVAGIVQGAKKKEEERGSFILERLQNLGLSVILNEEDAAGLVETYAGKEVSPIGIILAGEETKGGNPPFLFWKGRLNGEIVSIFWIKEGFNRFDNEQARAALDFATGSDVSEPPDVNVRVFRRGIDSHKIEMVNTYYPIYLS